MFANNPENYEGKYPPQLYGYYMHESEGQNFEDDFYDGVQEFVGNVEIIVDNDGRLLTGDAVEHFDDVHDEDRLSIISIKTGLVLHELDPGATLYSDNKHQIFQYSIHADRGKTSRLVQVYFNFDPISTKVIPDKVLGKAPKVIGSVLLAKQCPDYIAATEYRLTSDNHLGMVDLWGDKVNIEMDWQNQEEYRSFALYTLGELRCEFVGGDVGTD